ncbi:hypothetical protein [Fischerella thermalis]|uniref:hypothetical protein n=1 Tax=Fischerella thermalis TaxID=372787 RepID=UPI003C6D60D3
MACFGFKTLVSTLVQDVREERSALFFVYTANPPKRPELRTQYWDDTFPKPELCQTSEVI